MSLLKDKLSKLYPERAADIKKFIKEHGEKVVDSVNIGQIYGGMRGIKALVCDTSEVPPGKGLIIRGIELVHLVDKLPEEIFWLLLTAELPNEEELKDLQADLKSREEVPTYVWSVLDAMPKDSHPMTMFNTAILVLQNESAFAHQYDEGMNKADYWEPTLEDSLNLLAKIPAIAAYIYRSKFGKGERIESNKSLDWGANFAYMLGLEDKDGNFANLMRMYLTLHSDHEGGNASAFTSRVISSTLADVYYSLSGGLNALAGPLHGLANQECLKWVIETMEKFDGVPSEEQIEAYTWETLNAGQVVPGYGHAVLRITDPRFTAFHEFGLKHCADDPVFQTVDRVFKVVPEVLKKVEKIQNPWPNVDAGSGSLLWHYGLKEFDFYTVLFSVSRAMGICAQAINARAYGLPITRPKSLPTNKLKELAGAL